MADNLAAARLSHQFQMFRNLIPALADKYHVSHRLSGYGWSSCRRMTS
jgi:hypothetical protein